MIKQFKSCFKKQLKQFVKLKQSLGYKYEKESYYLRSIDNYAVEVHEKSDRITKKFADEFVKSLKPDSLGTRLTKVAILIRFSLYLCDQGIQSFVPKRPPPLKSKFVPYIFSEEEIQRLLNAADNLKAKCLNRYTVIFSIPAIIRLLYATGVRISEALSLKNEDLILGQNIVKVRDVKNQKERLIYISDSLVNVCNDYLSYRDELRFAKKTKYFFVNHGGNRCNQYAINSRFRQCLKISKIPLRLNFKGPRIHDLRHTFAVNSLRSMVESGLDSYTALPKLSSYLGHQSVSSTEWYLRFTLDMIPGVVNNAGLKKNLFRK